MESTADLPAVESKFRHPEITIIAPTNFRITKDEFEHTLKSIANGQTKEQKLGFSEIRKRGQRMDPDNFNLGSVVVSEIVGTNFSTGWSGLIDGIGDPSAPNFHKQTLDVAFNYTNYLVDLSKSDKIGLNRIFTRGNEPLELSVYLKKDGAKEYYVTEDGRHRFLALKVLQALGCYISISGLKVSEVYSEKSSSVDRKMSIFL